MTGLALYALAFFVAGHGSGITADEFLDSYAIYDKYYTGQACGLSDFDKIGDKVVRECNTFFIVYDLGPEMRYRFWKNTLFLEYSKQFYLFTK